MNLIMKNTLRAVGTLTGMALVSATLAMPSHAAPTASIAGTVTAAESLAAVHVAAFTVNADGYYEMTAVAPVVEGQYNLSDLESGKYKLGFIDSNGVLATEYYGDAPTLGTAIVLNVDEGAQLSGVNEALEAGASVEGRVASSTTYEQTDVTAYIRYNDAWHAVTSAYMDDQGNYDLQQLPAGTYKLQFEDYSQTVAMEWYDNVRTIDKAEAIHLASGETRSGINATLTVDGPQDPVTPQPPADPPTPPMPPTEPPVWEQPPTVPVPGDPNSNPSPPETKEQLAKAAASLKQWGKAKVGKKVGVRSKSPGEVNQSISWRANGKKVGSSYSYFKIPKKLKGKRLSVRVRFYNDAGSITKTLKFGKVK